VDSTERPLSDAQRCSPRLRAGRLANRWPSRSNRFRAGLEPSGLLVAATIPVVGRRVHCSRLQQRTGLPGEAHDASRTGHHDHARTRHRRAYRFFPPKPGMAVVCFIHDAAWRSLRSSMDRDPWTGYGQASRVAGAGTGPRPLDVDESKGAIANHRDANALAPPCASRCVTKRHTFSPSLPRLRTKQA
jgi:hypothetical protein